MKLSHLRMFFALVTCLLLTSGALAQDSGKPLELGKYKITTPSAWKQQQPKSGIVMYEFSSPAAEGDKADGRMTVMAAGGSVEANIDRWYGQFKQPDGADSKDRAKLEKRTIGGREVQFFDLSGTYKEPFGAGGDLPNYRMLAAIIMTPDANFYVKYYGPQKSVTANEKPFKTMIETLTAK